MELLLNLSEECAEAIEDAMKGGRFGIDKINPKKGKSSRESLEEECGNILAVLELAIDNGLIDPLNIFEARGVKHDRLRDHIYHATAEHPRMRRFRLHTAE